MRKNATVRKWGVATALVLGLLAASVSVAQVATSEFFGVITDPTGAAVPGVDVTAISEAQGLVYRTVTNEAGYYSIPNLPPAAYTLEAQLPGFTSYRRTGVVAVAARRMRMDVQLRLGEIAEVLEVSADAPLLETGGNEIGQTIENRRVLELPLNARNYLQLATLAVNSMPVSTGERQGTGLVLGGSRFNSNNIMLDGIDNNTIFFNRDSVRPSPDAIAEFRVITNSPSAEYGRSMGGIVTVVTKSGTNHFRGTAYHFHRNNRLNARHAFSLEPSPFFLQNQFGGSLGGPIVRDRLFFFLNAELFRSRQSAVSTLSVPPADLREGIFPANRPIFDPQTTRSDPANPAQFVRDPFEENRIPEARMDPVGRTIVREAWPLGNISDTQYRRQVPRDRDEEQFNIKIDHRVNDRNQLSGRYSGYWIFSTGQDAFPAAYSGAVSPENRGYNVMLSWAHTVSPTLLSELRVGANRFVVDQKPDNFGTDPAGAIGLTGTSPSKEFSSFPSIQTGYSGFGSGSSFVQSAETTFHIVQNLTWVRTAHTLKAGVDIRRLQSNVFGSFVPFGQIRFGPIFSSHPQQSGTGDVIADLLLGYPQSIQLNQQFSPIYGRQILFGAYLQDEYRVSRKLTFNLGLRYDLFTVPVDKHDRQSNPNLLNRDGEFRLAAPGGSVPAHVLAEIDSLPISAEEKARLFVPGDSRGLSRSNRLDFSPRLGFAYQLQSRTVLRGGFGVTRGLTGGGTFVRLGFNPPSFIETFLIAPDAVTPIAKLENGIPSWREGEGRIEGIGPRHLFENNRTQLTIQWNFNLQRELARDLLLDLGYIGSRGRNLTLFLLENQIRDAADYGKGQAARPVPLFGNIWGWGSGAISRYHAATVRVEKRYSAGLASLLSYTWAKSMDNAPGDFAVGNLGISVAPVDSYDLTREYGPSAFDVKHRFVLSHVYELPFGQGRRWSTASRALDFLVGGWQISGITSWQGGIPVDIKMQTTRVFSFNNQNRPDRVADGNLPGGERSTAGWFDASAFVSPPDFMLGNAGRNVLRAPGAFLIDAGIGKVFRISEERYVQFRTEFFNFTNKVNLSAPVNFVGNPNVGRILGAGPARQIQFALRLHL